MDDTGILIGGDGVLPGGEGREWAVTKKSERNEGEDGRAIV